MITPSVRKLRIVRIASGMEPVKFRIAGRGGRLVQRAGA